MGKDFEDYFSELQVDIISHCMEYADDRAEKVFVYCSCEANLVSCNFFYKLNNKITLKSKLNEVLLEGQEQFDVSVERQNKNIKSVIDDILAIRKLCLSDNRDMPNEIRLIYDAVDSKVSAEYSYEPVFSNKENMDAKAVFEAWFAEEQSKENESDNDEKLEEES